MKFPPAERLLLDAIGAVAAGNPAGFRLASDRRLDWDRVFRLADTNGLAPILYQALRVQGGPAVAPAEIRSRLERTYHLTGVRNMRLQSELARVLDALGQAGIPVILLKGAAFLETLWQNIALRPMADLDLLVHEEDFSRAHEMLAGLGYQHCAERRSAAWYEAHHHHLIPCVYPDTGTVVELHRNIAAPNLAIALDPAEFWCRSQAARVAGTEVRVLCPRDAVLHLCLHIACDDPFSGKARSLADLVALVQSSATGPEWMPLVREARPLARFLYYPLSLAREAGAMAVPQGVMAELRHTGRLGPVEDALLRRFIVVGLFRRKDVVALLPRWTLQQSCEALLFEPSPLLRTVGVLTALAGVAAPERGRLSTTALLAGACRAPVRLLRRLGRLARASHTGFPSHP